MLLPLFSILLLSLFGAVVNGLAQIPLDTTSSPDLGTSGPFSLSSINSESAFASFAFPVFPRHTIRIKKTSFCDPTVSVYTGYLDIDGGAKHLFFYFFESRRDPANDDVVMWINGGPGCTSSIGLLSELGPCSIDMTGNSSNGTNWNPYSWNNEANIFSLDQPVGVGYSYADFGETVETTEEAAHNVYAFLTIFFETFKEFSGRPLHLAGESYAGRYLPVFASEIYDGNLIAIAEGRGVINLKSLLIGNGVTDISTLYEGRYEIECGTAALDVPFQSIGNCVRIKAALPRCNKALHRSCVDHFDHIDCEAAVAFCDSHISTSYWDSGRSLYDVSKVCQDQDLCYAENEVIRQFLDSPSTRTMLGAESTGNFSLCSSAVERNFVSHLDKWAHHTQDYVAALLERGMRILVYAGTYDWQCNWVSNERWVNKLDWSGREAYVKQPWRPWVVRGKHAGKTKTHGNLTFASVFGAGHMVPRDKPAEALALVSRWLAGQPI
ncbi:Alpha/Beta hydrolase protein [Pisolithus croceorrhizus]|nr:Alpha/Beta hydrolase protein [Pisolithus croceorrhizus]